MKLTKTQKDIVNLLIGEELRDHISWLRKDMDELVGCSSEDEFINEVQDACKIADYFKITPHSYDDEWLEELGFDYPGMYPK